MIPSATALPAVEPLKQSEDTPAASNRFEGIPEEIVKAAYEAVERLPGTAAGVPSVVEIVSIEPYEGNYRVVWVQEEGTSSGIQQVTMEGLLNHWWGEWRIAIGGRVSN